MNKIFIAITIFGLFSECSQIKKEEKIQTIVSPKEEVLKVAKEIPLQILKIDSATINDYEISADSGNIAEKNISKQVLQLVQDYSNKTYNEIINTIGNIDGIGGLDTIQTRIWVFNDTVHVHSKWNREDELLWELKLKNPYLQVNEDNPLFQYKKCPIWTILALARYYTVPELLPKSQFNHIDKKWILASGIRDLERLNLANDSIKYNQYLDSFSGMLLECGEPEIRQLQIWHEPTRKFVSYYSP